MPAPLLGTAVVGAGPAGLLFCAVARRRWEQAGLAPEAWRLALYDKRASYSRTHRLRLDPRPFGALWASMADPRFDDLAGFLEREQHRPSVADLEQALLRLTSALGVVREVVEVEGPGVPLGDLRARVLGVGADPSVPFTIVGADSVHSAVRARVQRQPSVAVTHEFLARLEVRGPGVPRHLNALDTYRISKVVASVFDYRSQEPGVAQVDLFLTARGHRALAALGASPREPVVLGPELRRALGDPLLRRFLRFLRQGFGHGTCEVALHSVFRLEHAVAASRASRPADLDGACVFLVGDAGASLPFQRGMACLARSVDALADAHVQVARGSTDAALHAYDARTAAIVAEELRVVRARAVLVGGLREFVRISALLPFPIQSWFLSAPGAQRAAGGQLTPGLGLNAVAAGGTVVLALAAPMAGLGGMTVPITPALAVVGGFAGGVVYRATQVFEAVPNAWVASTWRLAVALLLAGGVGLAVTTSALEGRPRQLGLLVLWWVVGIAFAAGMALFEQVGRRSFAVGLLDDGPS